MCVLRQSTQVVVRIGSFMDASDGVTPETGITLGAADQAELLKAAGAATVDISGNTWAAITGAGGWYDLTLTTTDTNTVGDLTVVVQDTSVCLPVFCRFSVVEEAVYDQLYAASAPGAATPTSVANVQSDTDDIQTRLPAALVSGRMDSSVGAMAANVLTATAIAADAITAAKIATDAIGSDELAASAVTEIQAGLATSAALATVQADTDDIQARLPATLSGGRMRSQVEGMDAGTVTAAAVATDAIDSDAIAASAVTEIQAGLATSASIAAVQADTDDIQTRLPATLNGGRMRSHVEAMDAGTITAAVVATDAIDADAIATSAVTEIQAGLSTLTAGQVNTEVDTALADIRLDELIQVAAAPTTPTIDSFLDRITSKDGTQAFDRSTDSLEAVKDAIGSGGLSQQQVRDSMKLAPTAGAPAAGSVDEHLDDILADTSAMQPLIDVATSTRATNAGVDAAVTASHGVGSYVDTGAPPSVAAIADGVWDEVLAGHLTAGTTGAALNDAAAGGAGLTPQQVRDSLKLAASAGAPAAGSIDEFLTDIEGAGFDPTTDSLEEIRDRVDACCGSGGGGSDVNVEGI